MSAQGRSQQEDKSATQAAEAPPFNIEIGGGQGDLIPSEGADCNFALTAVAGKSGLINTVNRARIQELSSCTRFADRRCGARVYNAISWGRGSNIKAGTIISSANVGRRQDART